MQPVQEINRRIESREILSSPEQDRQAPVPLNGTGILSGRGGNGRLLGNEVRRD